MKKELRPFNPFFDDFDFFKPGFVDSFFANHRPMPPFPMKTFRNDVVEYDDRFEIKAELPGYKKEDISIKVVDGLLKVKAEKNEQKEEKENGTVIRKEIYSGSIARSFSTDGIDVENIKASFADGILKLTLPKLAKTEAVEEGKKIDIE